MPRCNSPGYYDVGRIEPSNDPDGPRPRRCGTYGVIRGDAAEDNGHIEWSHICEDALKTSRWFAFRIGPGDNGDGMRTDLLESFKTKSDAVEHLNRRYGSKFTRTY